MTGFNSTVLFFPINCERYYLFWTLGVTTVEIRCLLLQCFNLLVCSIFTLLRHDIRIVVGINVSNLKRESTWNVFLKYLNVAIPRLFRSICTRIHICTINSLLSLKDAFKLCVCCKWSLELFLYISKFQCIIVHYHLCTLRILCLTVLYMRYE